MITRLTSIAELKAILGEILFDNTNAVSKISDDSVLNGLFYGNAKVGQKALKDIALVESHLFPDSAFGTSLDSVSQMSGIAPRFAASESSTYVRLVADPGTVYLATTHTITGNHGLIFDLEDDITIGTIGFAYAKVRSEDTGAKTNIDPLTLNRLTVTPTGHNYVINEYRASGGRDLEQDDIFRKRIKNGANLAATGTLAMITQVLMLSNANVLKVYYQGINSNGQAMLALASQNGINFNSTELGNMLTDAGPYFSIRDLRPTGAQLYGVELKNIEYQTIDISFRVELFSGFDPDDVRKEIQIRISKAVDFRFWKAGQIVQWVDLLAIVKSTPGVKYVPDTYFTPNSDVAISVNKLPRLRGFLMLDTSGAILSNIAGTLSPIYYPANPDFSFQQTILNP